MSGWRSRQKMAFDAHTRALYNSETNLRNRISQSSPRMTEYRSFNLVETFAMTSCMALASHACTGGRQAPPDSSPSSSAQTLVLLDFLQGSLSLTTRMPLIEELPLSAPRQAQPGWAYVPDTTLTPITAIQPGQRKRGRTGQPSAATTSAKQQKAIDQRLRDLEKENHKDVHIPIPQHEGSTKPGKKMTSNVRRILGYNRTFAHYLDDMESALANGERVQYALPSIHAPTTNDAPQSTSRRDNKRKSMPPPPTPRPSSASKAKSKAAVKKEQDTDPDTEMQDPSSSPAMTRTASSPPHTEPPSQPQPTDETPLSYPPAWDTDPLLTSKTLPPNPTARVMALLISEPPLSYTAARAKPLDPEKELPVRHFCVMCGYWGKVKCRKCGERCCGLLECWKGHEAGGCGLLPY